MAMLDPGGEKHVKKGTTSGHLWGCWRWQATMTSRQDKVFDWIWSIRLETHTEKLLSHERAHWKIIRLRKGKLLCLDGSPSFCVLLAPRISCGNFFLAGFFRVSLDRLSERGTTHDLLKPMPPSPPLTPSPLYSRLLQPGHKYIHKFVWVTCLVSFQMSAQIALCSCFCVLVLSFPVWGETSVHQEFWFEFCTFVVRFSVYIVLPSVLSLNNLILLKT